MRIIEINEIPQNLQQHQDSSFFDLTNIDHVFIKNARLRLLAAFFKGLFGSLSLLSISGFEWCAQNHFIVGFICFMSIACFSKEFGEQRISGVPATERLMSTGFSLRNLNPLFAAAPIIFLLSTLDLKTMMLAFGNTLEVVGITCGVPYLIYGAIKLSQEQDFSKKHLFVGSASAFGGIALSVLANFVVSNSSEMSIFTASNYFSNSIAVIYAPDVVLPIDQ